MTSTESPAAISRQLAHAPQGVAVGPSAQFRQRARMRATVVLPGAALAREDVAVRDAVLEMAFSMVVRTCSWLTSSENVWGRYFLAMT